MDKIITNIKNMGYKFEQKENELNIYQTNDTQHINSDIFFSISGENELYKNERNMKSLIGKYDSLEFCLLILFFKLNSSKFNSINNQEIKNYFAEAKNFNDIKQIFDKLYGTDFVNNNVFFNQNFSSDNGFYVNLSNDNLNNIVITFKQGNLYFLVASKSFDKKHLVLPKLVELINKKNQFDKQLIDLKINVDEQQYLQLFSNYSFGFSVMISEIEKKSKQL